MSSLSCHKVKPMVANIRITDMDIIRRVERVRQAQGGSTLTKIASRLLIERITQMEERGELLPFAVTDPDKPRRRRSAAA